MLSAGLRRSGLSGLSVRIGARVSAAEGTEGSGHAGREDGDAGREFHACAAGEGDGEEDSGRGRAGICPGASEGDGMRTRRTDDDQARMYLTGVILILVIAVGAIFFVGVYATTSDVEARS